MPPPDTMPLADAFCPLLLGGLYPGISRGLAADVLATQSLGGRPLPVCTTHVAAGHGTVTDVLGVPSDTVSAHLEHVFDTRAPSAALVGILADAPTATVVFDAIEAHLDGPCIYNCTLSGPSGEDLTGQRALEAVVDRLSVPDLVSLRVHDASLLAGMEIPSLDDAQVAVQRIVQQGAQRVLLRCGRLPTHHFDLDSGPPNYSADLYYDGDDFALFEAPFLDGLDALHGASSGLLVPVLQALQQGDAPEPALQSAKARVTEALKMAQEEPTPVQESVFFDGLRETPTTAMDESEA